MKIGIFGCTADPFTAAHYEIVNKALSDKLVDKVIVIPSVVDYYRKGKKSLFSLDSRMQIIRRWFNERCGERSDVVLDFSEYVLATWSETGSRRYFDMLQYCIATYGKENEYYTIIGSDSLYNFKTWYKWQDILKLSKLIVVQRTGASTELNETVSDIDYIPMTIDNRFLTVSATAIRERLEKRYGEYKALSLMACNAYLEEIDFYKNTGGSHEELERKKLAELTEKKDRPAELTPSVQRTVSSEYAVSIETLREKLVKILEEYDNFLSCNAQDGQKQTAAEKETIAHTPIFDLVRLPEVQPGFRPVAVEAPDWVTIIVEFNGKYLMETQFRYGKNRDITEFPCGMVEPGEAPAAAAVRELKEETGYSVREEDLVCLGKYCANPAFMTNDMHYFYISLDRSTGFDRSQPKLDEHERLTSFWKDKRLVIDAVRGNSDESVPALAGCAMWEMHRLGLI